MTTTSSQPDLLATTIQAASLSELQIMLKDLRQMRIIRKQAGKKGLSTNGVRVELPVGCDSASAQEILKKLEIPTDAVVEYRENSKLFA